MSAEKIKVPTAKMSSEQSASALSQFYRTLNSYIADFGMPEEEVKNIQRAVESIVQKLSDEFGARYPQFKARSVHGVGSYYEQTKILGPDEFDFLYVLSDLSNENVVEMQRICVAEFVGIEVKVKDEWFFQTGGWRTDTGYDGSQYLSCVQFASDKNVLFIRDPVVYFGAAFVKTTEKFEGTTCAQESGILSLTGLESTYGPNAEIWFEWKSNRGEILSIKSDVTPVIRAFNVGLVTETDCSHEPYLAKLYSHGSYMVMPSKVRHLRSQTSFSPTFTETERELMLTLNDSHRIAYRCLKVLLLDIYTKTNPLHWRIKMFIMSDLFGHVDFRQVLKSVDYLKHRSFLSSYCLKTALLAHASVCRRETSSELCAEDVIEILLCSAQATPPTLPSTFLKDDNLFHKYTQRGGEQQLHDLIEVLTMLKTFHAKITSDQAFLLPTLSDEVAFHKVFSVLYNLAEENENITAYKPYDANFELFKLTPSAAFKYSVKKESLTIPLNEKLMLWSYERKKQEGNVMSQEEIANMVQQCSPNAEKFSVEKNTKNSSTPTEVQISTTVIYSRT